MGNNREPVYEGLGNTLSEAVQNAHNQIETRPGFSIITSKVVNWGIQSGGYIYKEKFYVQIVADWLAEDKGDV